MDRRPQKPAQLGAAYHQANAMPQGVAISQFPHQIRAGVAPLVQPKPPQFDFNEMHERIEQHRNRVEDARVRLSDVLSHLRSLHPMESQYTIQVAIVRDASHNYLSAAEDFQRLVSSFDG